MNKLAIFVLCLCIGTTIFSQSQKLHVEGAIVIEDDEDLSPLPGTIRWTGQDFEGFDGIRWKSLTCGCDVDCPDERYITHNVLNTTHESIALEVEMAENMPMRICYYPTADPSAIEYRQCEWSDRYGATGNEHIQTLSALAESTDYTIIIQTSPNPGTSNADCPTMVWEDISCPFTVTTALESNSHKALRLSDLTNEESAEFSDNVSEGSYVNPAPCAGNDNTQIRWHIPEGENRSGSAKHLLPASVKHAWLRYYIQVDSNWNITSGTKLPGLSSHVNGGTFGIAGGNGGGWSGLCKSWSSRGFITVPNLFTTYIYHLDDNNFTTNTGPNDHPCIVSPNNPVTQTNPARRNFGQLLSPGVEITRGQWVCFEQEIKLNTLPPSSQMNDAASAPRDGEFRQWINGVLVGERIGVNFTNNPAYHNIAFWATVFHGGNPVSPQDNYLYLDCVEVSDTGRIGCN